MNYIRRWFRPLKQLAFRVRLMRSGSFRYFDTRVYFSKGSHLVRRAVSEGIYEKAAVDVLSQLAKPGTTMFDIGANIGLISIPVLSRCPAVRVISFEPVPQVSINLERTWRASAFRDRWDVRPICITDHEGQQEFCLPPAGEDAFAAMVSTGRTAVREVITVPCATLDREWDRLGNPPVSAIKIDVEGGEPRVLAGGRRCIETFRPIILTEWNGTNLAANGADPGHLFRFCRSLGYRVHPIPGLFEIRSEEIMSIVMRELDSFLLLPNSKP